jgi:hypothetical protein
LADADAGRGSGRVARAIAGAAVLATLIIGIVWGAWIAGGSDSYCYVEQAERWATGTMLTPQPVGFEPPWPNPWLPLAPTGFVPSPTVAGALAPICPSGLSLTMAPLYWIGGRDAVFLVVPLLGALAVWLAFRIASLLGGPTAGALAAVLLATSPIFLFQVVQPMSDVPATAWWLLAIWLVLSGDQLPRVFFAGVATAAAVLTRPVLAPVGGVLLVAILLRPRQPHEARRWRDALWFCAGGAPGALALAAIQQALYGSPFRSGYGSASDLFSLASVAPNLARYAQWTLSTETPIVLLSLGALWLPGRRWAASTLLAISACVSASYLPYVVFDDWSYLRFLLPAVAVLLVCGASAAAAFAARLPRRWPLVTVALLAVALGAWRVRTAHTRYVFALHASEAKFRVAGEYITRTLPRSAVVLTVWHGGSVRYYGQRLTVAWDGFPPEDLDRTIAFLAARGRAPYLLLETSEEARFRERFRSTSVLSALDWPPVAIVGREVRLYRLADRRAYFEGRDITTTHVFPNH